MPRSRRDYCLSCHQLTRQEEADDRRWRCLRCSHVAAEGSLVFVVLSSPSSSRADDVWIEAVFSTLDRATAFVRAQELAEHFWIEPFLLDAAS